jgi:hypothetical protein
MRVKYITIHIVTPAPYPPPQELHERTLHILTPAPIPPSQELHERTIHDILTPTPPPQELHERTPALVPEPCVGIINANGSNLRDSS